MFDVANRGFDMRPDRVGMLPYTSVVEELEFLRKDNRIL